MAKTKKSDTSLADALAKHVPTPRNKTWFDKIDDFPKRVRLLVVKQRFQNGEFSNLQGGVSEIHRFCCDAENLTVSLCQFSRWLKA